MTPMFVTMLGSFHTYTKNNPNEFQHLQTALFGSSRIFS